MLRNVANGSTSSSIASRRLSLNPLASWLEAGHVPQPSQRFVSTRHVPSSASPSEGAVLPRFMRRQSLQPAESKPRFTKVDGKQKAATTTAAQQATTFRSRHYDATEDSTPKSEMRLLEPYVLSDRLKKLSAAGKIDDAIYKLKNSPLDAQNTQVWNTMIWEVLKVQRYSLAYQLFVDMKRRGFSPTVRTYETLFNGLAKIDSWETHTKQLANAHSLYESFQSFVASIKKYDPADPQLSVEPLAAYIRLLGNAGEYQRIFDVFYALDQDGPLSANQYIYTAMFQATNAAMSDTTEGSVKVAADARLLWNQMLRAAKKKEDFVIDSHTISSALIALSGGNEMDHELAFKIVAEYYGLDATKAAAQVGKIPLTPESLAAVLRLCNKTERYGLCAQFYQQVRRRTEAFGGVSILDRGHMEEILKADIALKGPGLGYHAVQLLEWMLRQEITGENGPKIRPSLRTYNLVMQACWYGADWTSATRTFDLMTGYHAHDFMDGSVAATPRLDKRGAGRSFAPNAEFMSLMLRVAIATRNKADLRQVLRIVDYLGYDTISATRVEAKQESHKVAKRRDFFQTKFASTLREAVDLVLEHGQKHAKREEAKKFMELGRKAGGAPAEKTFKRSRTAPIPRKDTNPS